VPFVFQPEIVDVDPEEGSISGTIGGVTDTFFPGTPDRLSAPPVVFNVIDGAIAPITVPATAAGTVMLCTPAPTCNQSGPPKPKFSSRWIFRPF
jgi:hypothetical protein